MKFWFKQTSLFGQPVAQWFKDNTSRSDGSNPAAAWCRARPQNSPALSAPQAQRSRLNIRCGIIRLLIKRKRRIMHGCNSGLQYRRPPAPAHRRHCAHTTGRLADAAALVQNTRESPEFVLVVTAGGADFRRQPLILMQVSDFSHSRWPLWKGQSFWCLFIKHQADKACVCVFCCQLSTAVAFLT